MSRPCTAPHWLAEALLMIGFLALIGWALPDLVAWLGVRQIQTSARAQCQRPAELEMLVIFVTVGADGRVRIECGPVAARGAHLRSSTKGTP